mmetsp:Transcript_20760/g.48646  ORF Transcript_20760/g.48646 Transcript_20760/m.48646 type:complete len:229 (+) Transcript_20760:769-1455(+)
MVLWKAVHHGCTLALPEKANSNLLLAGAEEERALIAPGLESVPEGAVRPSGKLLNVIFLQSQESWPNGIDLLEDSGTSNLPGPRLCLDSLQCCVKFLATGLVEMLTRNSEERLATVQGHRILNLHAVELPAFARQLREILLVPKSSGLDPQPLRIDDPGLHGVPLPVLVIQSLRQSRPFDLPVLTKNLHQGLHGGLLHCAGNQIRGKLVCENVVGHDRQCSGCHARLG